MEINTRNKSLSECKTQINHQQIALTALAIGIVVLIFILLGQNKIVIMKTPGMPADSVIEKTSMDKGAQRAVLAAVTSNLAQVNPANAGYEKNFLQAYLAPEVYTKVSKDIDAQVKQMTDQRELGSYYFVLKSMSYDPNLDKHFVLGDVHTVNAAKDTSVPYVFEYQMHVENYRPIIVSVTSYHGDKAKNTEWLKANNKGS